MQEDLLTFRMRRLARQWSLVIFSLGVLIFIGEVIEFESSGSATYPAYENLIPLTLVTGVIGLLIAFRWECLGAAITLISMAVNLGTYLYGGREAIGVVVLILSPIAIPAVLFLLCWNRSRGQSAA